MQRRRYIDKPLLVGSRKFHIRAYVLCVGSLAVYAYRSASAESRHSQASAKRAAYRPA